MKPHAPYTGGGNSLSIGWRSSPGRLAHLVSHRGFAKQKNRAKPVLVISLKTSGPREGLAGGGLLAHLEGLVVTARPFGVRFSRPSMELPLLSAWIRFASMPTPECTVVSSRLHVRMESCELQPWLEEPDDDPMLSALPVRESPVLSAYAPHIVERTESSEPRKTLPSCTESSEMRASSRVLEHMLELGVAVRDQPPEGPCPVMAESLEKVLSNGPQKDAVDELLVVRWTLLALVGRLVGSGSSASSSWTSSRLSRTPVPAPAVKHRKNQKAEGLAR